MMRKPPLIVIIGPTASGKSDCAIRIAKKVGGEIISADSRQMYRTMDIGTAKVRGKWKHNAFISDGIAHFCIDMASPHRTVTAAQFKQCAQQAIADMRDRNKIPILVGGTGFWVDTVVYDMDLPNVPPNQKLRNLLEKKTIPQLFAMLKKRDPRRAARIEQKNPRRLMRAIEIAHALGRTPAIKKKNPYHTLIIGLRPDDLLLYKRIAARTCAMIRHGLVAETRKLLAVGITQKRIREFGFEYAATLDFIQKKITRLELEQTLIRDTIHYARRQMRWFNRNNEIHWTKTPQQAEKIVMRFLRSIGKITTEKTT